MAAKILLALVFCISCTAAELRIQIVQGGNINSRIGTRGQSFVLRVTDASGRPIAGSTVILSAPSEGPSVDFGEGPIIQISTDSSGTATTPPGRPVFGSGPVRIEVLAAKDADSGNAFIDQMNIAVAAIDAPDDINIVEIESAPGAHSDGRKMLRVRVTDPHGAPIAGLHLSVMLPGIQGKASVFDTEANTGSNGVAEFQLNSKLPKGLKQIAVRATMNGSNSTRMIPLEQ